MSTFDSPLISKQFLRSHWSDEYEAFKGSPEEAELFKRLSQWAQRADLKETSAESALLEEFFGKTWGYRQSGQTDAGETFTLYPKFPVAGAGQKGGTGEADAALGRFEAKSGAGVPQIVCEFKDINSRLDAPQNRKGNRRSPVRQGLDYLVHAQRDLPVFAPLRPEWAIITDMNEFRLYWSQRGERQFMRFLINRTDLTDTEWLLQDDEDARFDRFVFSRIFHRDMLLVKGSSGRAALSHLIETQWVRERALENQFYEEYRAYRDHLYHKLLQHNGPGSDRFPGTKGRLVRLAQKILDRAIFIFFCEDMGKRIGYPPQLLRDFLSEESRSQFFDPKGTTIWSKMLGLFRAMDKGGSFGPNRLNQFNGGLFEPDADLEKLELPNDVFCVQGQGNNQAGLYQNKLTMLYLSAAYNYATGFADGMTKPDKIAQDAEQLGLYTLGRIFEQSITELEILEAEEDGRPSLNKVNKRKRDGVYYTPEWVVERIVDETLGKRLSQLRKACGWPSEDSAKTPKPEQIDAYEEALGAIKIVDPACGSGAFLITALRTLFAEWYMVRDTRREVTGKGYKRERDELIRDILRENIYGVDINPASVEIAKLALWLHTASSDKPLSSLDHHIREGNSLVGSNFFNDLDATPNAEQIERINPFDWEETFPEVFERGGFDIVIGNPPYVKLQNFRAVYPDVAEFLKEDRAGNKTYESTQTGNFDLYLPFIEKGIRLLNDDGRMGYIAPNLWPMNEYGEGLRDFIMKGRHLEGWIDFQSHQIFEEATIYTALQFFTKAPNDAVNVAFAPTGEVPADPFASNEARLPYDKIGFRDRWLLVTGADRDVIDTARKGSRYLDDPGVSEAIFQGLVTSADSIFHLYKLADGKYECRPASGNQPPYEVELEDELLKPLVSGPEAKRYEYPETNRYLIFPYDISDGTGFLIPQNRMQDDYPKVWKYLKSWEKDLRGRENNKMDVEDKWWGYVYPKNLTRHEQEKLIVAQTTPNLRVCAERDDSRFYLNNVRVNGIVAVPDIQPGYLLGTLNSSAGDFVFRKIAKPKDGGFFEANKQFIAPLPIPNAKPQQQADIAARASSLQTLHTRQRDLINDIGRRISALPVRTRKLDWLFVELTPQAGLKADAPAHLDAQKQRDWAKRKYEEAVEARYTAITARLMPGAELSAALDKGELKFFIDGVPVIDRVFVKAAEAPFILAQWTYLASTFSITAKTDGKKLCNALRKIAVTENAALIEQVIELQADLSNTENEIAAAEAEMNAIIYDLYGLSADQITHIEKSLGMRR